MAWANTMAWKEFCSDGCKKGFTHRRTGGVTLVFLGLCVFLQLVVEVASRGDLLSQSLECKRTRVFVFPSSFLADSLLLHCSIASLTHFSFLPLPPRCLLGSHDTHKYVYLRRRERKVNVYGHVTRVLQSHAPCITYTRIWYTSNPDNPIYLTVCDGTCMFTWLIVLVL
jgi:hypothetical protein